MKCLLLSSAETPTLQVGMPMFTRTLNLCAGWLSAVFDDADDHHQRRAGHWAPTLAASLLLAAGVVALTTIIVLGLDVLLHTQIADNLAR